MSNPETAVTVIEQSAADAVVEWTLDEFPVEQFNRLIPTQTLAIPTDLLRPVVQVVQLNPDPRAGDVYHSDDMPEGHSAPTKVALRKLATAAGVSIVDERRTDDGRDPDVIEVTCWAEMLLPTGQRLRATGMKRVDLKALKWKSDAHRAKYRQFFLEHVSSRAQNRAIRALLSLRGSYPAQVYAKPFAVVSFAPNMNHPEVRARILDTLAPALAAGYGPVAGSPPQLAAGPTVTDVPQAPDDDAPAPTELPGEKLAAARPQPLTARRSSSPDADSGTPPAAASGASEAEEEPDWMRAASALAQRALADVIRSSAGDEGAPKGKATKPQTDLLARVFAPLGEDAGRIAAKGIRALFGPDAVQGLSAAQARAIAMAADSDEHFLEHWTELAS